MKIITETHDGYDTLWQLENKDSEERWQIGQVNITGRSILVVAEKDSDVSGGYLAVDDFIGASGMEKCDNLPPQSDPNHSTTPPSPKFPDCDFEVDYCGWTNGDNIDNATGRFVFIRQRGFDLDGNSGPTHDHEFKNDSKTFKM